MRRERPRVEDAVLARGPRPDENVIVQVGLAVPVDSVRETRDGLPPCGFEVVRATGATTHHECVTLQVVHRVGDGGAVSGNDVSAVRLVKSHQDRDRSGRRDDEVVADDRGPRARGEDSRRVVTRILALSGDPPEGSTVAQSI